MSALREQIWHLRKMALDPGSAVHHCMLHSVRNHSNPDSRHLTPSFRPRTIRSAEPESRATENVQAALDPGSPSASGMTIEPMDVEKGAPPPTQLSANLAYTNLERKARFSRYKLMIEPFELKSLIGKSAPLHRNASSKMLAHRSTKWRPPQPGSRSFVNCIPRLKATITHSPNCNKSWRMR